MAEIWKNLKQLRAARNLTQEDVASKIGLTRQAISSYESGRTQPPIDILMKFAEIYGVDLEDILYGAKIQKKKNNSFQLISWLILFLWAGFQMVNLALLVIADTFYPIIINASTSAELRQNDLHFQLLGISSGFDHSTLGVLFYGGIVLLLLTMFSKVSYTLKEGRNYLLSVLLISAIMLVLSYLLLPDSYAVNVFVTLRFSWYILLATCLIVIVIQWGKRKVKQLKSK